MIIERFIVIMKLVYESFLLIPKKKHFALFYFGSELTDNGMVSKIKIGFNLNIIVVHQYFL